MDETDSLNNNDSNNNNNYNKCYSARLSLQHKMLLSMRTLEKNKIK